MFGENFLVAGVIITVASLIAFVLEKSTIRNLLEIACSFGMFFICYPFAILMTPFYIILYYVRIFRKSGASEVQNELMYWFSSYRRIETSRSTNGNIPTVPEVPEPDPTEG